MTGGTYLLATLGGRAFALPAAEVEQVLTGAAVTPVPDGPPEVCGLLYHAGQVVVSVLLEPQTAAPPLQILRRTGNGLTAYAAHRADRLTELTDEMLAACTREGGITRLLLEGETVSLP